METKQIQNQLRLQPSIYVARYCVDCSHAPNKLLFQVPTQALQNLTLK